MDGRLKLVSTLGPTPVVTSCWCSVDRCSHVMKRVQPFLVELSTHTSALHFTPAKNQLNSKLFDFQTFPKNCRFVLIVLDITIGGSRTACHCVSFTCHSTKLAVYQRATQQYQRATQQYQRATYNTKGPLTISKSHLQYRRVPCHSRVTAGTDFSVFGVSCGEP